MHVAPEAVLGLGHRVAVRVEHAARLHGRPLPRRRLLARLEGLPHAPGSVRSLAGLVHVRRGGAEADLRALLLRRRVAEADDEALAVLDIVRGCLLEEGAGAADDANLRGGVAEGEEPEGGEERVLLDVPAVLVLRPRAALAHAAQDEGVLGPVEDASVAPHLAHVRDAGQSRAPGDEAVLEHVHPQLPQGAQLPHELVGHDVVRRGLLRRAEDHHDASLFGTLMVPLYHVAHPDALAIHVDVVREGVHTSSHDRLAVLAERPS
mmetsp:Transcript_33366/g.105752  ORF Transcript_33366/g.105752 Transcript_33366/m.105752 type:complete len:264 (-) Transcript_33366:291-1082(-)